MRQYRRYQQRPRWHHRRRSADPAGAEAPPCRAHGPARVRVRRASAVCRERRWRSHSPPRACATASSHPSSMRMKSVSRPMTTMSASASSAPEALQLSSVSASTSVLACSEMFLPLMSRAGRGPRRGTPDCAGVPLWRHRGPLPRHRRRLGVPALVQRRASAPFSPRPHIGQLHGQAGDSGVRRMGR